VLTTPISRSVQRMPIANTAPLAGETALIVRLEIIIKPISWEQFSSYCSAAPGTLWRIQGQELL
jgi:hypothetical protein